VLLKQCKVLRPWAVDPARFNLTNPALADAESLG
jgi:hypothetical protein